MVQLSHPYIVTREYSTHWIEEGYLPWQVERKANITGIQRELFELVTLLLFFLTFIYLAAPGLNCSLKDLQSLLKHVGSLVAGCKVLVVACGI